MNIKSLRPILGDLLPSFPGFAHHKRLMLQAPIGNILRAIHFDTTGWTKTGFNVDVFVMPFCVPRDHLHLTFGFRIHDPTDVWDLMMPDLSERLVAAISNQGLPFLAGAQTLCDFVQSAERFVANPHTPESMAFALAYAGDVGAAIAMIDDYLPRLDLGVAWQRDIADESKALRRMLVERPQDAHRKMAEWEKSTIQALGLERFV